MPVATLIVNPAAGRAVQLEAQISAITALLAHYGFTATLCRTGPEPGSARSLAVAAAALSTLILACGGDGTVHEVLQGLSGSRCTLGVLPLGTANALARNLGLPLSPLLALERLLTWQPASLPLGEIVTPSRTRSFLVMAGCGPDGALVHTLPPAQKSRFGRSAYYAHAARLFATRRWPSFQVDLRRVGCSAWEQTSACAMLAARVPDLGGLFSGLTPLARLHHPHLHVHLLRAPAHLAFPAWFALRHRPRANPYLRTLDVEELRCTALEDHPRRPPIHAQADGEPLGSLPCSLRILPEALFLLLPPAQHPPS